MKRTAKRGLISLLLAVVMVIGSLPMDFSKVEVKAADAGSVTEGNVTTWDAAALLAATAGDNGLTLMGDGWSKNDATDAKEFDDGFSAVGANAKAGSTKAQTNGKSAAGTIPDGGCYVKYEASANGTLAIDTKIGNGKTFYVVDSEGTAVVSFKNETGSSSFNTITVDAAAGKTYYAYLGGATAQVWKVYFTKNTTDTWDSVALLKEIGTENNGLTVFGDKWQDNTDKWAGDAEIVGNNAKAAGTKAQTDGANANGTIPNGGSYIQYKADKDGILTIYEKTGNNKTFYVVDSDGTKLVEYKNTTGASTYDAIEVTVQAGKTYYAYLAGASAQVWLVKFEKVVTDKTWSGAEVLAALGKEDRGLTIFGDKWQDNADKWTGDAEIEGGNAKAAGTKAQTDGANAAGSIPNGGSYIQYTAADDGTLVIYEKTGNNKTFYVVDSDAQKLVEYKNTTGASTYDAITFPVVAGKTYYAYLAGASAQIWKVWFKAPAAKEKTPWADVAAPVIDKVEVDADGNIVVTYTALIDEFDGADEVRITMYYDGHEAETAITKKQTDTAVFTPLWTGNYSFKVVSLRADEGNKASEEAFLNDYVLPVKKPVVELAQNEGNGTVYLDWINVVGGDSFNVYYKEADAAEYTESAKAITTGDARVTGLTAGKKYDFKIEAVRATDGYVATYELKAFEVTENTAPVWRFASIGSAQETHATVNDAAGAELAKIDMEVKDNVANKVGIMDTALDIVNTDKSITFIPMGNGKISDGEEGFQYYYTMLDPNTVNFELTATFELNNIYSNTFDNQSGFGIIATDMLGYNYYQKDGLWIKHKQFNSVSTQIYSKKANFVGMRNISGYVSCDTTSVEGVTRETTEKKFKNTATNYDLGATFTFTLKKTDDGFVSICNGEEITEENLAMLSVQEDGSIALGVFAARNAGVKITDIKFTTSPSKGVTAVEKNEAITPNAAILSSNTANTSTYELIYIPNVDGALNVMSADRSVTYDSRIVKANTVVRVEVPMQVGMNEILTELLPSTEGQKITSDAKVSKTTKVEYQVIGNPDTVIYVSPDGKADADGSRENPYDLETVVKFAQPGQYIIMLNGKYTKTTTIGRSVSGTADKPITLVAEDANKVVFEGVGMTIVASYWHIYGIYFHYPKAVGIQISGNYNTIEMCTVEGSLNTGVQISRSGSVDRVPGIAELLWPSYNLVKNCESFDNCDAGRNDADGFAAKLTCGNGNTFYGCIGHNNVDDGWDLFAKAISGEIGQVTIDNCVAYNNGWLTYEDQTVEGYQYGEGNGFKLGGNDMYGGHILKNSVSFGNIGKGITSNSCPDCKVYNSTAYGNAKGADSPYSISLATKSTNKQLWEVDGLISIAKDATAEDQIPFSFLTKNNYLYNGKVSRNSESVIAEDSWFENVDLSIIPTRNADGTINMHGLLVPTDKCPATAGGRIDTSAKAASPVPMPLNNVDWSLVYDAKTYAEANPDIAEAFGANELDLFAHFITNGMAEGRKASNNFDVEVYRANYADLREVFGEDLKAYYLHFVQNGFAEGRNAKDYIMFNGMDISPIFNSEYYVNANPDLAEALGTSAEALFNHFVTFGMYEGRRASEEFDIAAYKANYSDVAEAFGDDCAAYYTHYLQYGKAEGRIASKVVDTLYNGVDYSAIYNAEFYAANNSDLAGLDAKAMLEHFVNFGMAEGRNASADFNVYVYKNNYEDLANAFGDDLAAYYCHYMMFGKAEGRNAAEVVYIYAGINMADVFDAAYYAEANKDVADAVGTSSAALFNHFVYFGMAEGRQAKAEFNVFAYANANADVAAAYADDYAAYYFHYVNFGKAEGRLLQ